MHAGVPPEDSRDWIPLVGFVLSVRLPHGRERQGYADPVVVQVDLGAALPVGRQFPPVHVVEVGV